VSKVLSGEGKPVKAFGPVANGWPSGELSKAGTGRPSTAVASALVVEIGGACEVAIGLAG
jgi:hypothetical protein